MLPFPISIIVMVLMGGFLPYFVVKRYWILKQGLQGNRDEKLAQMRQAGGYHSWVIALVVIIYAALAFIIFTAVNMHTMY